jgi:uncharacterized protein (TIGR03083 family)
MAEHLDALFREGTLLGDAAERTDLDTPIPTCPGWRMRDLVQHMGDVHRWAAAHVAERRTEGIREIEPTAGPLPKDERLLYWYREGHARLVETLQTAPADVECWSFLPAPSPLAFWARRQAHETAIHRADAESPHSAATPFNAAFAADGLDELLLGFFGRPSTRPLDFTVSTLHLHADDADDGDGEWLLRIGPEGVKTQKEHGDARCSVVGSTSDLYLLMWNRRSADGLDLRGDDQALREWRNNAKISWGRPRKPPSG